MTKSRRVKKPYGFKPQKNYTPKFRFAWKYLRMEPNGYIHEVEDTAGCQLAETLGYTSKDLLVIPWKECGFDHPLTYAKVNGYEYISLCAGIGMMKECTQYLFRKEFIEKHPEFSPVEHRKFLSPRAKDLATELELLYRKASVAELEALRINKRIVKENSAEKRNRLVDKLVAFNKEKEAANSKAENIEDQLKELAGKEVILENDNITIARMLQLKGALKLSRSVRLGAHPNDTQIRVLNDIDVQIEKENGVAVQSESDETHSPFIPYSMTKQMFTRTDGVSIISVSLARKLKIANVPCVKQVRDDNGECKGMLVVLQDHYFDGAVLKESDMAISGTEVNAKDVWMQFASFSKNYASYANIADYCAKNRTIRDMGYHVQIHEDGLIWVGRQIVETFAPMMNKKDIEELISYTVKFIKDSYTTEEGYYETVRSILPASRNWEELLHHPAALYSVLKQAWNHIVHAAGMRLLVNGAELGVCTDLKYTLDHYGANNGDWLPAGHCRIDKRLAKFVKVGDEIYLGRYPMMNGEPTILIVDGYSDVPGIVELSAFDDTMARLDTDFDFDHVYALWGKVVIKAAHAMQKLYDEANVHTPYYVSSKVDLAAKLATVRQYLTNAATMGNVGSATAPIFMLYSIIPYNAKVDTVLHIPVKEFTDSCGAKRTQLDITVADVLHAAMMVKVNVTVAADELKHMIRSKFTDTSVYKDIINPLVATYAPIGEYYNHPYDVVITEDLEYVKASWKEPKRIWCNAIYSTPINDIRNMLLKAVTGTACFYDSQIVQNNDGTLRKESGYKYVLNDGYHRGGFVYNPDMKLWKGIDIERWWMDTGVAKYDSQKGWAAIGLTNTLTKSEGKTFDVDGVTYVGKEGLLSLMTQDGFIKLHDEFDSDDETQNEREYLNIDNGSFDLTLGTFRYRLSKVISEMNKKLDDGPHKSKREFRADADKICIKVIKAITQIRWNTVITTEQAELMLYDEKAKYLLSESCVAWAAADVQEFCNKYEAIIKEKIGEEVSGIFDSDDDFNLQ